MKAGGRGGGGGGRVHPEASDAYPHVHTRIHTLGQAIATKWNRWRRRRDVQNGGGAGSLVGKWVLSGLPRLCMMLWRFRIP